MSKRKQENVSDIVAEMRNTCHNPTLGIKTDREKGLEKFLKDIMIEYADRIEDAARRVYNKIDRAVCSIEEVASCEIDDVRRAMDETLGDYYE